MSTATSKSASTSTEVLEVKDLKVQFTVEDGLGSNSVSAIVLAIQGNTVAPILSGSITTGNGPQNVALDPVWNVFAYASCRGDGIVSIFDQNSWNDQYPPVSVPGIGYIASMLND